MGCPEWNRWMGGMRLKNISLALRQRTRLLPIALAGSALMIDCGAAAQPVYSKPVATTAPWCPLHSRILRKPRTLFRFALPQLSNPQRRRLTRHLARKLQPQLLLSGAGMLFRKGNSRWSIPVSIAFLCQTSCWIPSVGFRALCLWIEVRTIGSFHSAML